MKIICWAWCLSLVGFQAWAGTLTVTGLHDAGPGSFRQAIEDANQQAGSEISLASLQGTIELSAPLPVVSANVRIAGPGADRLTVDAKAIGPILEVAPGITSTVSGLTLRGGTPVVDFKHWPEEARGGGVVNNGDLTLLHCRVVDCVMDVGYPTFGVGVYNGGSLAMKGCRIDDCGDGENNFFGSSLGGAVGNEGVLVMEGCSISNSAAVRGGGLYNRGTATLLAVTIADCYAGPEGDGGAIYNHRNGRLDMNASTLAGNFSFWGGGMRSSGVGVVRDSWIDSNVSYGLGGALVLDGTNLVSGCVISGNATAFGASVSVTGSAWLENCVFRTNASGVAVGTFDDPDSQLEINHCTFVDNVASEFPGTVTAAVEVQAGEVLIANSLFARNTEWNVRGAFRSGGGNLVDTRARTDAGGLTPFDTLVGDAKVGSLADNGGPAPTCGLLPDSPALDRATAGGLSRDQRGARRTVNVSSAPNLLGDSDAGALELNPWVLGPATQAANGCTKLVGVANGISGVSFYSTRNAAAPTLVGQYTSAVAVNHAVLTHRYAYLACGADGLEIVDISDPANPLLVTRLSLPGESLRLALAGSRLFVAAGSGGLLCVDIGQSRRPRLLGTGTGLPEGIGATDVDVRGGRAVVAAGLDGTFILDITRPSGAKLVAHLVEGGAVERVALSGSLVYIAIKGMGLRVYDLTNPTEPRPTGFVLLPGIVTVSAEGPLVVALDAVRGLQAFRNERNPTFLANHGGILNTGSELQVVNRIVYVSGDRIQAFHLRRE